MLLRILAIITPILVIVLVGYLYARRHRPNLAAMNTLTVDLLTPMLVFSGLTAQNFDLLANRQLLLASVAVIAGSGLLAWFIAHWRGWDTRTFVPPMMFGNTGNMGLPIALLAFGPEGLPPAVALFVLTNLLHFTLGVKLVNPRASLMELMRNPIVLASVAGIIFNLAGLGLPDWLAQPIAMLGNAAIPLMLFALGARMIDLNLGGWRIGIVGAMVCPLAGLGVAALIVMVLPLSSLSIAQLFVYASLPPAVMNFLIAERYLQEPDKVASIVLLGNVASLIFVPLGLALAFA
ncbi:MAG TPA: AEC family transporter [Burkholderiales bacterium]|nr:AEC family transporter [Burkholderiales bacterium]